MASIAIGIAFLLSLASPGLRVFEVIVGVPVLQLLPPGQRGVILVIVNYWLPALLIYLALRLIPQAARLQPTRKEAIALRIANTVLVVYLVARVFASTIEGGGAGYLVASFAIFTLVPALLVVAVVVLRVMARLFRPSESDEPRPPLRLGEVLAIAVLGFGPVVAAIGNLFIGANSPVREARGLDDRMATLCATAGEKLLRSPQGGEGVYLDVGYVSRFNGVDDGRYRNYGSGSIFLPVADSGVLLFHERPSHIPADAPGATRYQRISGDNETQSVDELISRYGVFRTKLTTEEDLQLGLVSGDLEIKDLQTGEIIATSRFFANTKSWKVCGTATNGRIDEREFILRALQSPAPH